MIVSKLVINALMCVFLNDGRIINNCLDSILFIEADRNYCNIVSSDGGYLVVCTLKTIEKELKNINFLRVHRSFMVNLRKLDVVSDNYLEIGRKAIPLSKSFKGTLWSRLHTI